MGEKYGARSASLDKVRMNGLNNYAAATPALDAEHVYVFWPGMEETLLVALTHEGREVWTAEAAGEPDPAWDGQLADCGRAST